jgi:copper chaperone CopZ
VETVQKPAVTPEEMSTAVGTFLLVSGMGCPTCALRVRNGLLGLNGVLDAQVNLERGLAQVLYDPARLQAERLPDAVAAAGNDSHHHYSAQVLA